MTNWNEQNLRLSTLVSTIEIPGADLAGVDGVEIHTKDDLSKISSGGGVYWIWTNEPVIHALHKSSTPEKINGGEIIYNGVAKDDVRSRIAHHLFGEANATWSAISVDLFRTVSKVKSHRKSAMGSGRKKVPYIGGSPIRTIDQLLQLNLSPDEVHFAMGSSRGFPVEFRNGIDVREDKHLPYIFKAYFITGIDGEYSDFIERRWRHINGRPRLCSYKSGR